MAVTSPPGLLVLIPVFNDWTAAARLLTDLDAELTRIGRSASVLIVDDGSTESEAERLTVVPGAALHDVRVLHLRRNLGAQRAIAIGLSYAEANLNAEAIVVMDGDGEDRPSDIPALLAAFERANAGAVVFAERTRRSEGLLFASMYVGYRLLHHVLTGERVRVGNFSIVPMPLVRRLVAVSDLWNHYAAAVFKSRIPYLTVSTARGVRYHGQSHMNYVALITHGLSAMSVFGDRIGVRMLAATTTLAAVTVAAIVVGVSAALWSAVPLPPWAPFGLIVAALALFQTLLASLTFVFIILGARDTSTFIPLRDYSYFVSSVRQIIRSA